MLPAGSPSRECRSAPTSPPAPSSASPVDQHPGRNQVSEISEEPQPSGAANDPSDPRPAGVTMPAVEEAFEEIDVDEPRVGIIMGSKNDKPKMQPAGKALEEA